jgi:succinyl-CoA synthetase beta subunit
VKAAEELGFPVVIKAQVQIGGRGKAGGIKLAGDRREAERHAEAILGMDIRGLTVREVYVEKASGIAEEYYAAIVSDRSAKKPMGAMLGKLNDVFVREDATLVEVNPLLVTDGREVIALDAKLTVDGNTLFRHPDVAELRDVSAEDPRERTAGERGLTYVKLDGNVGILGNGAGLVMATLDVVAQAGGRPANFSTRAEARRRRPSGAPSR